MVIIARHLHSLLLLATAALFALLMASQNVMSKPRPQIEIMLETKEAFLGDTVIIEVRWRGLDDPVDFRQLREVGDVERETSGTRIAVIDGEVVDIVSRRIEIKPRRVGRIEIGPFRSGDTVSNVVTIDVTKPHYLDWVPSDEDIRLDQYVSSNEVWLQQQVTVDVVLRTRHPIADEKIELPTFDGFRVVTVFSERRTLEEENGGWSKTAWRWLVFPQRSGQLEIGAAKVSGLAMKSRAERANFELTTPATPITVKPSAFGAYQWWIAATNLAIADEWSNDPTKLAAGDEVERVIKVTLTGALPEQIPDLAPGETRGLTITPLGNKREGKIISDVLRSTAEFRFRVRAMSPVPVFIDTVRLRWWDVTNDREEESIIPARRIDIAVPERGALVDQAVAREAWTERLIGKTNQSSAAIVALLTLTAIALGILALSQRPAWGGVYGWLARRRLSREISQLARSGNVGALHARLRDMSGRDSYGKDLGSIVKDLESSLFATSAAPPDLTAIATAARRALLRPLPRESATALPQL